MADRIRDGLLRTGQKAVANLVMKVDFDEFKRLLIRWFVCMHISFSQVESTYFYDLLYYCCSSIAPLLPRSGNTIRGWIMTEFTYRKEQVKLELERSKSNVHLSFDLWTSPNALAMLGVVAHYFDQYGKNRVHIIALRRLRGSHSGENMAALVVSVIEDFALTTKLGYFVLDNATSNDTCITEVLQQLRTDLKPKDRRLRCFGHIVNLVAKAFLFGTEADAIDANIAVNEIREDEVKALQLWRRHGAIGKLHNIIVFIRRTPQRREEFANLVNLQDAPGDDFDHLMVTADNDTRWNSTYTKVQCALKLRDRIDLYVVRNRTCFIIYFTACLLRALLACQ